MWALLCLGVAGLADSASAALRRKPAVDVVDLRCEYLKDPLGLDVRRPRLSWRLVATDPKARGQRQRTYHIRVASRLDILQRNAADVWDSGEVGSDASVHVVYDGKPLRVGMECFWTVQVRDNQGILSAWSEPARWTVGPLGEADWTASWIGTGESFTRDKGWPPPDNTMPDPWFRKRFYLPRVPARATAYVGSIGYHELFVNGVKVTSAVLTPSVTDNSKRARYVTYEIADYLRPGTNVVGLWLGVSWSIFPKFETPDKPRAPLVIGQFDLRWPDGKMARIGTDQSWKSHPSPNTLLGVWDFMHFGGELYNAAKEITNWCNLDLNDSAWKEAAVFKPKVVLSADKVEPNRPLQEIRPVAIEETAPGVYRADMGVNFAGWTEIDLFGRPGDRIDLLFSERDATNMTHRLHSAYLLGPSGKGTFRNRFNYGVGRWLTIKGLAGRPTTNQIRGWLVRPAYERDARFECDHKLLNDIYQTTLWTFENLSLGGYVVDCPQRERMGYGGDAHSTTPPALCNYRLGAFYTKWAEDWRDVQGTAASWNAKPAESQTGAAKPLEPGNLPYTAPTYWGGGGPAWSGICVTLPWEVFRRYGDKRILEDNLLTMLRWLAFLETKATNDLLVRWGGEWDFLGDWLWPGAKGVNGDTRETLFFNNCYWIYNLQTVARVAGILGMEDVATTCRTRADAVRQAVHARFFDPKENSYVNGSQAYLAIALLVGVPPEDVRPAVWKRLEDEILVHRKGHIWAGITGGALLMQTLLEAERHDLIHAMATKEDYPGWGDMLRQGATTWWESWENNPDLSYLHSSYLYIGQWFHAGLAGIQPDPAGGGFKNFVIKPAVLTDRSVKKVNATYESLYGPISVEWEVTGKTLHLKVSVPPNTTATCFVPTSNTQTVEEGGRPESQVAGIEWLRNENNRVVMRLQPGHYAFTAEYAGR